MKIETVNGVLTARAETKEDIQSLLRLESNKVAPVKAVRKYKKQMPKQCNICGKKFKGNVGLGIHKARTNCHEKTRQASPIGAGSLATV